MKVPPKRKGNHPETTFTDECLSALNESPSEKEGKSNIAAPTISEGMNPPSMKALPKRKGNARLRILTLKVSVPSMKALPKRKGNNHGTLSKL